MADFISHKISFSDLVVSSNGSIDCDRENISSLSFKNEGTVSVQINSVTLSPGSERNYSVQDESNIVSIFTYSFADAPGTKKLIVTKGKRVNSVIEKATFKKNC